MKSLLKILGVIVIVFITLWGIWNYMPLSILDFNPFPTSPLVIEGKLGAAFQTINLNDSVKDALFTKVNANFAQTANTTTPQTFTSLQQFGNASSTIFSCYGPCYFGATATSSLSTSGALTLEGAITSNSTATSTFSGGISTTGLNLTKGINIAAGFGALHSLSTATSSLANGLSITSGCYRNTAGNCLLPLDLTVSQVWTGAQLFGYSASSTFSGGLEATIIGAQRFFATSTTATSTLPNLQSTTATTSVQVISNKCTGCSSGYARISDTCALNAGSPSTCTVTLDCAAEKVVKSGGVSGVIAAGAPTAAVIFDQRATDDDTMTTSFEGPNAATDTLTAYAICENR